MTNSGVVARVPTVVFVWTVVKTKTWTASCAVDLSQSYHMCCCAKTQRARVLSRWRGARVCVQGARGRGRWMHAAVWWHGWWWACAMCRVQR